MVFPLEGAREAWRAEARTKVCVATPIRMSICLASARRCVSADLILMSGDVSVMELPRSSILPLIALSSSLTEARAFVSSVITSDFELYLRRAVARVGGWMAGG